MCLSFCLNFTAHVLEVSVVCDTDLGPTWYYPSYLRDVMSDYTVAFSCEGSCGQIPFAGAIVDWIDACHQLYERDNESVYRVSELKTLSRSDKVVNALCVRAEVQLLTRLPDRG